MRCQDTAHIRKVGESQMIDWAGLLKQEDVEGLWNGLLQLVSRHPAVRPLHFATDGAAVTSQTEINADLAQELFLELFQKQRFEHYAANRYSSAEIENELAHIELPNLVGARLRKRYPESFRMARRVSALLKTSPRFTRFGANAVARRRKPKPSRPPPRRQRLKTTALTTWTTCTTMRRQTARVAVAWSTRSSACVNGRAPRP